MFPHHLKFHCNSYLIPHLESLQSQEWLLTVQQMCGMFYGRCECCRVWWCGFGGLLGVLETAAAGYWVEMFLCTVERCSEQPQQSTIFHGCHIKVGEKMALEGSLLTSCSHSFSLTLLKRAKKSSEGPSNVNFTTGPIMVTICAQVWYTVACVCPLSALSVSSRVCQRSVVG